MKKTDNNIRQMENTFNILVFCFIFVIIFPPFSLSFGFFRWIDPVFARKIEAMALYLAELESPQNLNERFKKSYGISGE